MIIGIGMDMVEMERVKELLDKPEGERFLMRILSPREREVAAKYAAGSHRLAEFVAGRFAAKEAVAKALGCGIGTQAGFHDIVILPAEGGQPLVELSPAARDKLRLDESARIHLSITHTRGHAAAYAILERV